MLCIILFLASIKKQKQNFYFFQSILSSGRLNPPVEKESDGMRKMSLEKKKRKKETFSIHILPIFPFFIL
jgi:hypothetical protein